MFLKKYPNLCAFKPYFARHKRLTSVLLICMVTGSSMGVLLSYLMSQQLIAISDISITDMIRFTLYILATVSIHHFMWFFWDRLAAIIGNRVAADIRKEIFTSTLGMRYLALKSRSTGYFLERLNDDTNEVSYFVQNVTGTLVDVFTNVSFLVIIYIRSWACGLLFSIGIIGLYLIDLWKIRVELRHTRKIKQLNEALNSGMTEAIRGAKDIKGLGIRDEVVRRNEEISAALARQNAKMKSDVTLISRFRTYGQWLIDALIVFVCALWLLPAGKVTVVLILIIFNYKGLMYETVGYFSNLKGYYVQGEFKAGRILELIRTPERDIFGAQSVESAAVSLEACSLSFSYDDTPVITDVSFSLAPRTAGVLIGASGSGKSTLFGLLTKLYEAQSGTIRINGTDIRALDEASLNRLVSIVNQEPFLFSDTICNNLLVVRPSANDEDLRRACEKAGILDEILSAKDGFDTILTENGSNLSGGQKQRLAIARAILKDTPLILFDEPTSALDAENQALLLRTIRALKAEKTVFVIAHKLNDLSAFDRIFTMEDGRLRESGK